MTRAPPREFLTGPYEWTVVAGAGHFRHREKPDEMNRLILDGLKPA